MCNGVRMNLSLNKPQSDHVNIFREDNMGFSQPAFCAKRKMLAGFSLVETLVAITILLVAILVPMRIITQSIKAAAFSREELTAVLLAQEGLEVMLRLRDNDVLDGSGTWNWYSNLPAACKNSTGCGYDVSASSPSNEFISCSGSNCVLRLDDESSAPDYYYSHDGNDDATIYTRKLFLEEVVADQEVEVTAVVEWNSAALNSTVSISVQTSIFNQYDD